ncbi:hypothetical protein [Prauserella rugosa]|uniref:Uncharacterized protein n=1 Tax=Prauserella rugosa TaxID=43354 RepID=A0A660CMF9_9PSEU|nr:hypothetical protein JD82_04162 [Prauserella rugosa]
MTATPTDTPDPTMNAIVSAVSAGQDGHVDLARRELLRLWARIGVTGDPFHRCTLAHTWPTFVTTPPSRSCGMCVRSMPPTH